MVDLIMLGLRYSGQNHFNAVECLIYGTRVAIKIRVLQQIHKRIKFATKYAVRRDEIHRSVNTRISTISKEPSRHRQQHQTHSVNNVG